MANLNSENPHVGRKFQEFVQTILEEKYNTYFEQEAAIPIGRPPKEHKFDLANADRSIVAECKCYTWTDSGNVPSAKLMGLDEAVFYFGFLPAGTQKILCMKESVYKGKTETLAEYYVRVHGHLLGDVSVFEISDAGVIRVIREGSAEQPI
jgi:hypothetical protein